MPRIPLYQPQQVDFTGSRAPRLPLTIGSSTGQTVNPQAMTRAGEAQIRALGHAAQTVGAVGESRTRTLEEKFFTIARIGDQANQMGWRMFDLGQEAQFNSNMAKARNLIISEKEKALQDPNWAEAEKNFQGNLIKAESDVSAGLFGIRRARAVASFHEQSLRAAVDVRAKAREKLISQTLASDYERRISVKKQLTLPETTWEETQGLLRNEKAKNAQRVAQGMISAEEATKADVSLNHFATYQEVKRMIDADPRTAALGWDSAANPKLMVFARNLPTDQREELKKYATTTWKAQVDEVERLEKKAQERHKLEMDANMQAAGRGVVRGEMGQAGVDKLYSDGKITLEQYNKLSALSKNRAKGNDNPEGNADLKFKFRRRITQLGNPDAPVKEDKFALRDEILAARGGSQGLSDKQTEELLDEWDGWNKSDPEKDIRQSFAYKEADKEIAGWLRTTGFMDQYSDPEENARIINAQNEFEVLVTKEGMDIPEAKDLIKRKYDPSPNSLDRLPHPRFGRKTDDLQAIFELTTDAYQAGRIDEATYKEQVKLLKRIKELREQDEAERRRTNSKIKGAGK